MTTRRQARLNETLKRELSELLVRKVRDPRAGAVVVTDVRVTADLRLARVSVRPLGRGRKVEEVLEGLTAAAPFLRHELARVLRIRRIPELRFHYDSTLEEAFKIERILKEVLPPKGEAITGASGEVAEGGEGGDGGP